MKWKNIISERTKLIFLILTILAFGGLIFYAFVSLLEHMQNWWWLLGAFVYFLSLEVVSILKKRFKLRFIQIIERIILFPIIVLKLLLDLAKPAVYIFISILYTIMVAFLLPYAIIKGINVYFLLNLNTATMIFIIFAFGSILCVHQSKIVQSCVCSLPPLNRGEHKFQLLGRDLSLYILHPKNMSFVLFLLYFVYLSISGFTQIQNKGFLVNEEIDGAILKAFLVFIACTNMVAKSHEVDVQAKELLGRMLNLVNAHDDK